MKARKYFDAEIDEMKQHLLLFNPDPESNINYYSIYQGDKLIGRSNRACALDRFLLNIKLAPKEETQNIYLIYDNDLDENGNPIKRKIFNESGDFDESFDYNYQSILALELLNL